MRRPYITLLIFYYFAQILFFFYRYYFSVVFAEALYYSFDFLLLWIGTLLIFFSFVFHRGTNFQGYYVLAYVSIRQHTSAYVSIRQHTSAILFSRGSTCCALISLDTLLLDYCNFTTATVTGSTCCALVSLDTLSYFVSFYFSSCFSESFSL